MLEPCAVKVASTVLRRGVDCEISVLSDKDGVIKKIPLDIFKQINPREIILLEADEKVILERLHRRDNVKHDVNLIREMRQEERSHALFVAESLKIPIKIITGEEYHLLKDYSHKLYFRD